MKRLLLVVTLLLSFVLFVFSVSVFAQGPSGLFNGIWAGNTTFDAQRHGSTHRMIETGVDAMSFRSYVHVDWTVSQGFVHPDPNRAVHYSCYDWTYPGWTCFTDPWGGTRVTQAGDQAGYSAIETDDQGRAVAFYDVTPPSQTSMSMFPIPGLCIFSTQIPPGQGDLWARGESGSDVNGPVYHVGAMDSGPGLGNMANLVYWRYVYDPGQFMYVWEGPVVMDQSRAPSQVLLVDGERVIYAFSRPRPGAIDKYDNDLAYYESNVSGADWIASGGPPVAWAAGGGYNTTDYVNADAHRCYVDLGGGFDSQGQLHLVYPNPGYNAGIMDPHCDLLHWQEGSPPNANAVVSGGAPGGFTGGQDAVFDTVARATWWTCVGSPGDWNQYISKPTLAFGDGSTICDGQPNLDYLYVVYSMFGWLCPADQADASASSFHNSNVWMSISDDMGATWNLKECLTTTAGGISSHVDNPPTRSGGCNCNPATPLIDPQCANPCLSEHWPSAAELVDDHLHVFHVGDLDAGGVVYGEGNWTRDDMMYLPIFGGTDGDLCPEPCDCGPIWGTLNGQAAVNPIDVVYIVQAVYLNNNIIVQPPNCPINAGDANCDCTVNPVDVVYYVLRVYRNINLFCPDPCTL